MKCRLFTDSKYLAQVRHRTQPNQITLCDVPISYSVLRSITSARALMTPSS